MLVLETHTILTVMIRYENIERRLEEGSQKFKRLELMLWGIYPLIIGLFVAGKFG